MHPLRKFFWLVRVSGAAAALLLALAPSVGQGQDGTKVLSIISTTAVNGEVEPCG